MKTESPGSVAAGRPTRFAASKLGVTLPFAFFVLGMPFATALPQVRCQITQVTATSAGRSGFASLSADGTRIAFVSNSDLTGANADGNPEIFLFDVSANAFTQITSSTDFFGTDEPSVNGDGTRIAFQSDADLTGGNPDANSEIFLFDTTTGTLTQVTRSTGFNGSFSPSISTDGTHVAFQSDRDLIGGDLSGLSDIFVFQVATGTITQITNSSPGGFVFGCYGPSVNADGTRIAFGADTDLTGGNADGNNETFLFDAPSNTITQLTTSTGGVGHIPSGPAISADGTRVALFTDRDLTGGNADGNNEIFVVDTQSSTVAQITQSSGASNALWSISANGTGIAFFSAGDLTGDNADGNTEIFLADTSTGVVRQVTNSIGDFGSFFPSIDAGGRRLAFSSDRDLTGGNPDGNSEVFLFDQCTPTPQLISIDIKPGSFPNSINPASEAVIPIAILTTDAFDATTVDPLSVRFGRSGARESHGRSHIEDTDGDGDLDLVLHFRTRDTGIVCGDTSVLFTGETFGGQAIQGTDSIKTVGCKEGIADIRP